MSDNDAEWAADMAWSDHETDEAIEAAVAAEREACAKIADEMANDPHGSNPSCSTAELIASDIRARGRS